MTDEMNLDNDTQQAPNDNEKIIIPSPSNPGAMIVVLDEPGSGGACHEYVVVRTDDTMRLDPLTSVSFQNGPIGENGINGCQNEDLLAIVKHRLECFQAGPFPSPENERALNMVDAALAKLKARTLERRARGVEGTNQL